MSLQRRLTHGQIDSFDGEGVAVQQPDPIPHQIAWPERYWTWSLKSGGCYVGFKKRLHLDAFAYLSAQRDCVAIDKRPIDAVRPLSPLAEQVVNIATRDRHGQECLYGVQDCDDPGHETWRRQWRRAEREMNRQGKACRRIQSTDLYAHQQLIRNWLKMMDGVRTAELDPDFELQAEVIQRAAHPQGISIRDVIEAIDPPQRRNAIAQVYWLIHEQELMADITAMPLSEHLILYRPGLH